MFTIRDIVGLAIQIEENGERLYRNAAREIPDPSISLLLLRLADEEVKHGKWFSDFDDKANEVIEGPQVEEAAKRILQSVLGDESFSLKDVDFSSMKGTQKLLGVAIEFEQDTVLFYEMIRSFVEDKTTLDHLNTIIEEENDHIRLLEACLKENTAEMK